MSNISIDHWEKEVFLSLEKRVRRYRAVAIVATSLAILLTISVILMLPLKDVKPIVVTVDKHTGLANVESSLGNIELDDEEALTQAYIYQYIRDLETYDSTDQAERINAVFGRTQGSARLRMQEVFTMENPLNPQRIYGGSGRVKVRFKSIVLTSANTAQVRIELEQRLNSRANAKTVPAVVTMSFGYDRSKTPSLEQRWSNPVGFFVDSYRIDQENLSR